MSFSEFILVKMCSEWLKTSPTANNEMKSSPSKLHSNLPGNVVRRTTPLPQVVPQTAKDLVAYQILLASSGPNRRKREHTFIAMVPGMDKLCDSPDYNKTSAPQRGGPEVLLKLEHRGGNTYKLTIAESELLHPGEVSSRLRELEQQDAQLPRKKAA